MRTSETLSEIATALSKAQGEMVGAVKNKTNGFLKSNYSDLASVVAAISTPFSNNGLCFVQAAEGGVDGAVAVVTRIMHISGEWMESNTPLPPVKNDAQGHGSTITYARRYGLQCMAGVPSIDDDGNDAVLHAQEQPKPVLTPDHPRWGDVITAYKRDGNFDSVLTRGDISKEHQAVIIEQCKNVA